MRRLLLFLAFFAIGLLAQQQQRLDNQAIIKLHAAGMTDDTILHLINTQPGQYSAAVADLIALKQAGISERIIRALLSKASLAAPPAAATPTPGLPNVPAAGATATPSTAAPAATATPEPSATPAPQAAATVTPQHPVTDFFYKKGDQWISIQPETVTWKAGGIFKSVLTAGAVKRDINGTVTGVSSKHKLKAPAEFVIYIPGGVDLREYQLLRLRPHDGMREFRAAIGDDFHISGGRDLVPFEGKPVTRRGFLILLKDLAPGEYGWIPPDAALSTHDATAPPGKIFTFMVQ